VDYSRTSDVRRLAADLEWFLDQLLSEVHSNHVTSAPRNDLRVRRAQAVRRDRLERYVGAMSTAQRLRLAGALHLLSRRLDEDLAHPDQRAGPGAAERRPIAAGRDPR
jgi:hypothetical protein